MMDSARFLRVRELVNPAVDGVITETEWKELEGILLADDEAVIYYAQCIEFHLAARKAGRLLLSRQIPCEILDDSLLILAEYERRAPSVQIPRAEPVSAPAAKPSAEPVRPASRFSLFTTLLATAAFFALLTYIHFYQPPAPEEVATVTDMIGARWSDSFGSIQTGSRLCALREPFILDEGLVKIRTDEGVEIVIEGPGAFLFRSDSQMELNSGRLFAHVTPSGVGFTVDTDSCRVIDLGTEFGMEAAPNGATELHVFSGKTSLVAEATGGRVSQMVTQGDARQVVNGQPAKAIPLRPEGFVRRFDSQSRVVWRGQKKIDLADIVGGGNGLGTGTAGLGIDPYSGLAVKGFYPKGVPGDFQYRPVQNHFIDGVFVPDGGRGDVEMTSAGHSFAVFNDSSGLTDKTIMNVSFASAVNEESLPQYYTWDLDLASRVYGIPERPAISMNSNSGITFDLQQIRQLLPDMTLERFSAVYGYPGKQLRQAMEEHRGNLPDTAIPRADVFVFLDGVLVHSRAAFRLVDEPVDVSIPIRPDHRFLTLVITDHAGMEAGDWILFGQPVLEFRN